VSAFDSATLRDRGEGTVQYVILVPIVFLVVLLGVQAATYFHAANIASNAATRAVSVASRAGASSAAGAQEASKVVAESGAELLGVSVDGSSEITAAVTVRVRRVVPFFSQAVSRRAAAPKERYLFEDER